MSNRSWLMFMNTFFSSLALTSACFTSTALASPDGDTAPPRIDLSLIVISSPDSAGKAFVLGRPGAVSDDSPPIEFAITNISTAEYVTGIVSVDGGFIASIRAASGQSLLLYAFDVMQNAIEINLGPVPFPELVFIEGHVNYPEEKPIDMVIMRIYDSIRRELVEENRQWISPQRTFSFVAEKRLESDYIIMDIRFQNPADEEEFRRNGFGSDSPYGSENINPFENSGVPYRWIEGKGRSTGAEYVVCKGFGFADFDPFFEGTAPLWKKIDTFVISVFPTKNMADIYKIVFKSDYLSEGSLDTQGVIFTGNQVEAELPVYFADQSCIAYATDLSGNEVDSALTGQGMFSNSGIVYQVVQYPGSPLHLFQAGEEPKPEVPEGFLKKNKKVLVDEKTGIEYPQPSTIKGPGGINWEKNKPEREAAPHKNEGEVIVVTQQLKNNEIEKEILKTGIAVTIVFYPNVHTVKGTPYLDNDPKWIQIIRTSFSIDGEPAKVTRKPDGTTSWEKDPEVKPTWGLDEPKDPKKDPDYRFVKKFKVNGIDVEYLDDVPGLKFGLDFWVKRMPAGSKKLEAVWEIQTFVVDRKTGRLKKTWTWKFKVTIERSDSSNNSLFDNTTTKVEILEKPKQLKEGDKRTDEFKDIVEPVLKEYLKPDNK